LIANVVSTLRGGFIATLRALVTGTVATTTTTGWATGLLGAVRSLGIGLGVGGHGILLGGVRCNLVIAIGTGPTLALVVVARTLAGWAALRT
jgi:hypothetical protein